MKRLSFCLVCGLVSVTASAAVSPDVANAAKLTAAQIISKNVAARGGLKAWHAVYSLTLSGRMEAGGKKNQALPFVMKMKRPRLSRLEISFQGQKALQIFDGEQGWKLRPFLGRDELESFTPTEQKGLLEWQELDGPLVDYAEKGITVKLQGTESVEGHKYIQTHADVEERRREECMDRCEKFPGAENRRRSANRWTASCITSLSTIATTRPKKA